MLIFFSRNLAFHSICNLHTPALPYSLAFVLGEQVLFILFIPSKTQKAFLWDNRIYQGDAVDNKGNLSHPYKNRIP
jgi:hypothetical protein